MSARSRIPPLLEACIRLPPEASLLLLSGVIDAAPHWLTVRFLSRLLGQPAQSGANKDGDAETSPEYDGKVGVVLVSWMRDREFWRAEARRGAGLDLAHLETDGCFAFVDGLTGLFSTSTATETTQKAPLPQAARQTLPQRGPPPARGAPIPGRAPPAPATQQSTSVPQQQASHVLTSPSLTTILSIITNAISTLKSNKIFLILDSPTLLLASSPSISATDLSLFTLALRAQVHSTLLVVEADAPLLAASAPDAFLAPGDYLASESKTGQTLTPLDREHAGFVVGQAHAARWVVGVRGLETGRARDVSGVVSVRRAGDVG
ncbi:hypothetical protein K461DRAFT_281372 [Myriangium duriaei CBS 260.36]|uniref:Uncharacterized protein n=1 Tax=Myriangium duriaei CBS 260.36 TaxID=1168546 RepID=A0A9P4MJT1_9PEZI|nr:hypothetical protein K461DRAFT_281372 [Myriangium duriaei CBS 260.36]